MCNLYDKTLHASRSIWRENPMLLLPYLLNPMATQFSRIKKAIGIQSFNTRRAIKVFYGEEFVNQNYHDCNVWRNWYFISTTYCVTQLLKSYRFIKIGITFVTFFPHAHFEALFQPAVLTLVSVVLVHWTVLASAALVGQVSSNRPFEEAFASWNQNQTDKELHQ